MKQSCRLDSSRRLDKRNIRKRRVDKYYNNIDGLSNERCLYCGLPAEVVDHFLPLSKTDPITKDEMETRSDAVKVPSCVECNAMVGGRQFPTIKDKREYIHAKIRKKYNSLINSPWWSEEDLEDIGDELKNYIEQKQRLKTRILARLDWPKLPDAGVYEEATVKSTEFCRIPKK